MSVKNRILTFISSKKLSVREFEKSIGASNGYINSISRSIGVDKIESIIEKYPTLNIDWLVTGRGEMEINLHFSNLMLDSVNNSYEISDWKRKYEELSEKYTSLLEQHNALLNNTLKDILNHNKSIDAI